MAKDTQGRAARRDPGLPGRRRTRAATDREGREGADATRWPAASGSTSTTRTARCGSTSRRWSTCAASARTFGSGSGWAKTRGEPFGSPRHFRISVPSNYETSQEECSRLGGSDTPDHRGCPPARGRRATRFGAQTGAIGHVGDRPDRSERAYPRARRESRNRRNAQRGEVLAVQRAHQGGRGGGQLPVHHHRAERGGRAGRRTSASSRSRRSSASSEIVWDTIAFHDIAGLVAGASKGEGLGNQFLREHPRDRRARPRRARPRRPERHPLRGQRRPGPRHRHDRDRADLRRSRAGRAAPHARRARGARRRQAARSPRSSGSRAVIAALQAGRPARTVPVPEDAPDVARLLQPLTAKPVLFVANVDEGSDEVPAAVAEHAADARARGVVAISSRLEAELSELDDDEAATMRAELGVSESGLQRVVRGAFELLELDAFFTAGEAKPAQCWHLRRGLTAWHAAGEIHTRHPEGLRARRGDRLEGPRRRRRLRGRPRPRHAAARGPRLRDGRRRRADGEVHAVVTSWQRDGAWPARAARTPCVPRRPSWCGTRAWQGSAGGRRPSCLRRGRRASWPAR